VTAAALQAADARLHNIPAWLRASLQPALELSRHTKQLLVQTDAHGKNGATAGQGALSKPRRLRARHKRYCARD
jgi:hypothetical protein